MPTIAMDRLALGSLYIACYVRLKLNLAVSNVQTFTCYRTSEWSQQCGRGGRQEAAAAPGPRLHCGLRLSFARLTNCGRPIGPSPKRKLQMTSVCSSKTDDRPKSLMGIDLQHLRFAVVAADHGSFRQAAEFLSIKQSTFESLGSLHSNTRSVFPSLSVEAVE